jgi:hypothetical protein
VFIKKEKNQREKRSKFYYISENVFKMYCMFEDCRNIVGYECLELSVKIRRLTEGDIQAKSGAKYFIGELIV